MLAALSRRRSRVQVPSGPHTSARPGSSVGTSVRLKIGRSAVRPRPWPPSLSPGLEHRPPAETHGGRFAVRGFQLSRGVQRDLAYGSRGPEQWPIGGDSGAHRRRVSPDGELTSRVTRSPRGDLSRSPLRRRTIPDAFGVAPGPHSSSIGSTSSPVGIPSCRRSATTDASVKQKTRSPRWRPRLTKAASRSSRSGGSVYVRLAWLPGSS